MKSTRSHSQWPATAVLLLLAALYPTCKAFVGGAGAAAVGGRCSMSTGSGPCLVAEAASQRTLSLVSRVEDDLARFVQGVAPGAGPGRLPVGGSYPGAHGSTRTHPPTHPPCLDVPASQPALHSKQSNGVSSKHGRAQSTRCRCPVSKFLLPAAPSAACIAYSSRVVLYRRSFVCQPPP